MQVYVSNKEIAQIAEGVVTACCGKSPPKQIDIDAVANFLGLPVVYEQIVEEDKDKIGFTSNGVKLITVYRNGKKERVLFPKDVIVLEKLLLKYPRVSRPAAQVIQANRRRFTLAHEIGHVLIGRATPGCNEACYNRVYDSEQEYSISEFRDRLSLEECQANAMAAMILMPYTVLSAAIYRFLRIKKIPIYGDCVFLPKMKPALQSMSEELGVSYSTMLIQLKKYDLLEYRNMQEYFLKTMPSGGDA